MKKQLNNDPIILKTIGMVDDFVYVLISNGYGVMILPEGDEHVGITIVYPNVEIE